MEQGSLKTRIHVYGDKRIVESVYKALTPDNMVVPNYMVLEEKLTSNEYVLSIKTRLEGRCIDSTRQTVDEILSLLQSIEKTIGKIE